MTAPYLRMHAISKHFPGVAALKSADLEAYRGEAMALMGANGAGKSTLMHVLGGIISKDEGEISVRRVASHGGTHVLARAHPPVEAVGGAPGHERVESGIDEVGTNLEGLHPESATTQRLEEAEGDGGLSGAAPHPGDDQRGDHRRSRRRRRSARSRRHALTPNGTGRSLGRHDGTTRTSSKPASTRIPGIAKRRRTRQASRALDRAHVLRPPARSLAQELAKAG